MLHVPAAGGESGPNVLPLSLFFGKIQPDSWPKQHIARHSQSLIDDVYSTNTQGGASDHANKRL